MVADGLSARMGLDQLANAPADAGQFWDAGGARHRRRRMPRWPGLGRRSPLAASIGHIACRRSQRTHWHHCDVWDARQIAPCQLPVHGGWSPDVRSRRTGSEPDSRDRIVHSSGAACPGRLTSGQRLRRGLPAVIPLRSMRLLGGCRASVWCIVDPARQPISRNATPIRS